jgi:two-component sensor histidine kinase
MALSRSSVCVLPVTRLNDANGIPRASAIYWVCQAAGWGAYLTYVLGGYFIFAPTHNAADVVSIVVFCIVPPILMTHGLRAWMYVHGWSQRSEWRRKARQFGAAIVFAVTVTIAVGVVNGVAHGRVWIPTPGMWWMLLAYALAFGGWLWIYEMAHARRRREALERLARDAQLRALRAQLNPHFLFNSLNSVRSLIAEDPTRAASMVTGLSELLRYSLTSDRKDIVPLADELGVIDEYVNVERVRFEERLRVEQTIDPHALQAQVPPMIVQTLVENAVKHGVSMLPQGGLVRLDVRVRDDRLEIVVRNTGRFNPAIDGGGFGLQNATERLRLLYGDRASLTVREESNAKGEHTVAELLLPLELLG